MDFQDSFSVPVPPAQAWDVLTDIERVYPCLPGAELSEVKDNEFRGLVTVRLGPITAVYEGRARFEDMDPDQRTLVIRAEGRDKHGQGTAKTRVRASLQPENGGSTRVDMANQVEITGKAAQFGRGILQDVSKEILSEFAANLRAVVMGPTDGTGSSTEQVAGQTPHETDQEHAVPRPAPAPSSINVASLGRKVLVRRVRESPNATIAAIVAAALVVALILRKSR
jgi:carbon monoxide dehydrogenase subunit G